MFQNKKKIHALFFRYPLKVVVDGMYGVKLYPEDGEKTTILNIKRGIISALAVPLMEGDRDKNMVHKTRAVKKKKVFIITFNNRSSRFSSIQF